MTLETLKKNVLKMIEEISTAADTYTDDPDIDAKLNTVINQVLFEVARMKKIPAKAEIDIDEPSTYDLRNISDTLNTLAINNCSAKSNVLFIVLLSYVP